MKIAAKRFCTKEYWGTSRMTLWMLEMLKTVLAAPASFFLGDRFR
jgi:hypothetical protein